MAGVHLEAFEKGIDSYHADQSTPRGTESAQAEEVGIRIILLHHQTDQ